MSPYTFTQKAKAWVAAIGALASAVLAVTTADFVYQGVPVGLILTGLAVAATRFATFKIPNAPAEDKPAPPERVVAEAH